jgi:fibro-slime domain-containing protein
MNKHCIWLVAVLLSGCSSGSQSQSSATPSASASVEAVASSATPTPESSTTAESSTTTPESSESPTASPTAPPAAVSLKGEYFILPGNHPDVEHDLDNKIVTGLVEKQLGPDGLPVATQFGRTFTGGSGPITDINAAGELMWYSTAGTHGVRSEKVVTDALPLSFDNFFPDGRSGDGGDNGYLAVHWSGCFTLPAAHSIGFSLGSDDDSWVFVDGGLVDDNGGVKPLADAPFTSAQLAPGWHRFDVFYADRHTSGAQLHLSTDFPFSPCPAAIPTTAVLSATTAAPLVKKIKKHQRIRVYGIHFDVASAHIQPQSENVIKQIAEIMRNNPTLRFQVEGHTDSDGGAAYNLDLSQRRAQSVVDDLVTRYGIARSRLVAKGFGLTEPVKPNTTPANKALNRRVEILAL